MKKTENEPPGLTGSGTSSMSIYMSIWVPEVGDSGDLPVDPGADVVGQVEVGLPP